MKSLLSLVPYLRPYWRTLAIGLVFVVGASPCRREYPAARGGSDQHYAPPSTDRTGGRTRTVARDLGGADRRSDCNRFAYTATPHL